MPVIRTYVPESFQNYNHLVQCPDSGQAAAVDPYDGQHLLDVAKARGLAITQIWITHEHGDHIRHLSKLRSLTGAPVFAPQACRDKFEADHWLSDGDSLTIGHTRAQFWATPGHTPGHGVYYLPDPEPELVCGDTLFNAGVGNTRSGNVDTLYETIKHLVQRCDPATRIYPGHDYLLNNLNFALSLEPGLASAQAWVARCSAQTPDTRATTTLADEAGFNPFLRLDAPGLIQAVRERGFNTDTPRDRFVSLRQLRDQW
ncbi:MAG: hydroxyacylglutathione hydrolase C-terminal domain-containing protein [Saccharospirillum sp.]